MTNHPIVDAQGRGEEPRPSQLPKELSKLAVDLNIKQVFENEDKWNLNGLLAFQRAYVLEYTPCLSLICS